MRSEQNVSQTNVAYITIGFHVDTIYVALQTTHKKHGTRPCVASTVLILVFIGAFYIIIHYTYSYSFI